jgi:hypothetical protein
MTDPRRGGNALVMAVLLMALVGSVLATTMSRTVASYQAAKSAIVVDDLESAVQVVLHRRTKLIQEAIAGGAPNVPRRFDPDAAWLETPGRQNYGTDFVAGVPVRWAIEPMRTLQSSLPGARAEERRQDVPGSNPVPAADRLEWVQNPRPDSTANLLPGEVANDVLYLFRIRAEARIERDGQRRRAIAQRFIAAQREPLFRYIIFYAQEGPKGDLEFIHDGTFQARGNVHSNGAIYMGGDTAVTSNPSWRASSSTTELGPGPTGAPARITGYDGIFRLNKPTLFGLANGFNFTPQPASPGTWYDTSLAPTVGEEGSAAHYPAPASAASINDATWGGSFVNPHRVRTDTLATLDSGNDDRRRFNPGSSAANSLRGAPSAGFNANDSRDRYRGAGGLQWATASLGAPPDGFARQARTRQNGGSVVRLPAIMRDRPFEAQRLATVDIDGDPSTEHHEFAQPVFLLDDGSTTTAIPTATRVTEAPGSYLAFGLGAGNAMTRASFAGTAAGSQDPTVLAANGHNGWTITSAGGGTPTVPPTMGLVVRERAVPFQAYLPATGGSLDGINSLPYAYGKHNRSVVWPWHGIDITAAGGLRQDTFDSGGGETIENAFERKAGAEPVGFTSGGLESWGIAKRQQSQTHVAGGLLTARAVVGPAPPRFERASQRYIDAAGAAGQVEPRFYRQNARFFHAIRMQPDTAQQGLLASIYNDHNGAQSWRSNNGWTGPFSGTPVRTLRTDPAAGWLAGTTPLHRAQTNSGTSFAVAGTYGKDGNRRESYSIRMVGFVRPPTANLRLRMQADDGYRVWFGADGADRDRLVLDAWRGQGFSTSTRTSDELPCIAEAWTPLVVEYFQGGGDHGFRLQWSSDGGATYADIPLDRLCPPLGASAGTLPRGSGSSGWRTITARFTPNAADPANAVLGLMLRPQVRATGGQAAGVPLLLDGRDPYIAIGWHRTRGVITEYRGVRAAIDQRTVPAFFVGRSSAPASTSIGHITSDPALATRVGTLAPRRLLAPTTQFAVARGEEGGISTPDVTLPGWWSMTTADGTTYTVPQGVVAVTTNYWAQRQYRSAIYSRWAFSLDAGHSDQEVFRWTANDPFRGRDTTIPRRISAYVDATGGTRLRWGGSNNAFDPQLQMQGGGAIGNQGGGVAWDDLDTERPRVINRDGDGSNWHGLPHSGYTEDRGRWFVMQWVNATNTTTLTRLAATQPALPTLWTGLNGTTLGVTPTSDVMDDNDSVGQPRRRRYTYEIGGGNTFWYIDQSGLKPRKNGSEINWATFQSEVAPLLPGTAQIMRMGNRDTFRLVTNPTYITPDTSAVPSAPSTLNDWAAANGWSSNLPAAETARTFMVQRSDDVLFDLHSRISAFGAWLGAAVSQVLPWSDSWNGLTTNLPRTFAFRPDQWTGPAAPVRAPIDGATTTSAPASLVASPRWLDDQPAVMPATAPANVWLRLEKTASERVRLSYALVANPAAGDWNPVLGQGGGPAEFPLDAAWLDFLVGPYLQGESTSESANLTVDNFSIDFYDDQAAGSLAARVAPANLLDAADMEASASGTADAAAYIASQYQVFFGPFDVTEDICTWRTADGRAVLNETWIYNLREFWSQSRWWDDGTAKDATNLPTAGALAGLMNRERMARVSLLDIDMDALQRWLVGRTIAQAAGDAIPAVGPPVSPGTTAEVLRDRFNGLFYAARTNRYPSNPAVVGPNPWNPLLPNQWNPTSIVPGIATLGELLAAPAADRRAAFPTWHPQWIAAQQTDLGTGGTTAAVRRNLLQPFVAGNPAGALDRAPAFRPSAWHHGVRLSRANDLFWGFDGVAPPAFGTGKSSIVTPNAIYLRGDFNTVPKNAIRNGQPASPEIVPCAIMADEVNVLSNAWNDETMRRPGFSVNADGGMPSTAMVNEQASLARGIAVDPGFLAPPAASTTTIVAALVTNNQPTTREGVAIGESATVIDTVRLLENWNGADYNYTGSLVVLDSKRTSEAMLLGSQRVLGPTPFGHLPGWTTPAWTANTTVNGTRAWWNAFGAALPSVAANQWQHLNPATPRPRRIPGIYSNPATRSFAFNPDLLTPEGTPPFAPFGVSAAGVGGWSRSF